MDKLKIISMSSETYPGGRIESFTVPLLDDFNKGINHNYIMPLFRDLGFMEDSVNDLDIDFENKSPGDYFFSYGNSDIKSLIIVGKEKLSIIFDTTLGKEEISKIVEKYFKFPEQ